MKLWNTLKSDYRRLRDGKPGHRFGAYVEYRRARRGSGFSFARLANSVGGVALVVLGAGIGWLPGPGGFIAVVGLALIALEVPLVATAMDAGERAIRRLLGWLMAPMRRWLESR